MSVVQFTRYKGGDPEQVIKNARVAKQILEKHGAEFLRLSRFHTGSWAGEWLVTTRYANWEVYGKVQDALAKDPEFAKVLARAMEIGELTGRNIAVGIDL
jgi:hypothetical protein